MQGSGDDRSGHCRAVREDCEEAGAFGWWEDAGTWEALKSFPKFYRNVESSLEQMR